MRRQAGPRAARDSRRADRPRRQSPVRRFIGERREEARGSAPWSVRQPSSSEGIGEREGLVRRRRRCAGPEAAGRAVPATGVSFRRRLLASSATADRGPDDRPGGPRRGRGTGLQVGVFDRLDQARGGASGRTRSSCPRQGSQAIGMPKGRDRPRFSRAPWALPADSVEDHPARPCVVGAVGRVARAPAWLPPTAAMAVGVDHQDDRPTGLAPPERGGRGGLPSAAPSNRPITPSPITNSASWPARWASCLPSRSDRPSPSRRG